MSGFILFIHFFVCIFMIIVILLQAGKGADIGAAFGGSSQNVFGPRGAATFLSKITTIAAVIFLCTSIYLAQVSKQKSANSVLQGMTIPPKAETLSAESQAESQAAPAAPVVEPQAVESAPALKAAPESTPSTAPKKAKKR